MDREELQAIFSESVVRHLRVKRMLKKRKNSKRLDPNSAIENMIIQRRKERLKKKMRALG